MSRRGGNTDSCVGCFVIGVLFLAVIGFIANVLDDEANKPEPQPKKPELEEAAIYVTGDDGGAYKVTWTVWTSAGEVLRERQVKGVIGSEPHIYAINLDGFRSDHNEFFLGTEDIDIEASKTEPWVGDLTVVLEVNGKLVECVNNDRMTFDADSREAYKGNIGCRLNLWFF